MSGRGSRRHGAATRDAHGSFDHLWFRRRQIPHDTRRSTIRRPATDAGDGGQLAYEFASYVNRLGVPQPLRDRSPTHLLAPTAVVAAQLSALQMNDWPEPDAGVAVAWAFTKPEGCEDLLPGQAAHPSHVRSWGAQQVCLSRAQFQAQLHSPPYEVLLHCDTWKPISQLVFPSLRHSNRAVQAVQVTARRAVDRSSGSSSSGSSSSSVSGAVGGLGAAAQTPGSGLQQLRPFIFTWCLEKVLQGPLEGCWVTVGVRVGNYAL